MRLAALGLSIVLLLPWPAPAQGFSQRGFVEGRGLFYPQTAPHDDRQAGADLLLRYEPSFRPVPWLTVTASVDARLDTLGQVERIWHVDWLDRRRLRPVIGARRLAASLSRGTLTLDVGRQFVRWGKADILNPTDRFAPRDFMEVVASDFLAVAGARLTHERNGRTIDLVWVPFFTPSRLPLAGRRWAVQSQVTEFVATVDGPDEYPRGSQFGARWNHVMSSFEYSLSFYSGFNHLPLLETRVAQPPVRADIVRRYPQMRMYGADAAVPLKWFTVKGEAAAFTSTSAEADDYALYVIQIERQQGEWSFVGGYAGQAVITARRALDFAPDRGLARAFLGRDSGSFGLGL